MDFSGHSPGDPTARKPALRATLLAKRRTMTDAQRRSAADRLLTAVLAALPVSDGLTVAAHSPMPAEPGGRLPDVLREAGYRVLLPITLPDNDLDWAQYRDDLRPGPRGPAEPTGPRLGPAAITHADAVIVPALAVGPDGHRLGRGGGSYDRALARLGGRPVITLLFDGEWPQDVPFEAHDRPVSHVVTPSGGYRAICDRPPTGAPPPDLEWPAGTL